MEAPPFPSDRRLIDPLMRGPVETPSGSQAGPLKASRKLARRIACEPQNRKTHDCEALPTPRLAEIGQVAELLSI
jgi:hypothetical protein